MNQDPFPRAGIHRDRAVQALLNVLVALSLVLLGSAVSMPVASARTNSGGSAPAWPAQWNAYTYADGTPVGDVDGDVRPTYLDLAGVPCATCVAPAPSVAFASDGPNAFFRIRLATDITDTAQHGASGGAFLVQIADADGQVRAVVGVDGADPARRGVYVADPLGAVVRTVEESPRRAASPMRVVDAADGSGHFFLDFRVPLRVITAVSGGAVTASTPIKIYAGSSAATDLAPLDLATINADFMLGDVSAVDFTALAPVRLVARHHLVAFDSTGGSPVSAQRVPEGFPVAAPATPTRVGHTFGGWYAADSAYDFSAGVTRALTITARWSRARYPVSFDSTGGSAVADQEVLFGDTIEAPTDPVRENGTFIGWFSAAVGGEPVDLATQRVTAPTELYAHWRASEPTRPLSGRGTVSARSERNAYSVVFYPNGGSAVASQTVSAGGTASVPTEPTRAGYVFKGWFDDADGDSAWDFSSPINEATTLYAHWTPHRGNGPGVDPAGDTAPDADSEQDATANATADADADADADASTNTDTEGEQGGAEDGDSGDGTDAGATALPNTGNQVPAAVVPSAVLMLLAGLMLLRRDRRRLPGAHDSE